MFIINVVELDRLELFKRYIYNRINIAFTTRIFYR